MEQSGFTAELFKHRLGGIDRTMAIAGRDRDRQNPRRRLSAADSSRQLQTGKQNETETATRFH